MDKFDAEKYSTAFGLLADVLERTDRVENDHQMSFALGDLARRLFVGTRFDPPDELLEQTVHAIRSGDKDERERVAIRLRDHANHLREWESESN